MGLLDHYVYIWKYGNKVTIISLYVDDIFLVGNYLDMMDKIKEVLRFKFEMKDMGEASYVLGIRVSRDMNLKKKNYI